MEEIWKDIQGYEGLYQVSNLGNVKSLHFGAKANHPKWQNQPQKLLKQRIATSGYLRVELYKPNSRKCFYVHSLVATTFLDRTTEKSEINHIDGNKLNNNVENLEWVTRSENQLHAISLGLRSPSPMIGKTGGKSPRSHPVIQYDLNGKFMKLWLSISDASRELKISTSSISQCASGRHKKSRKYIWRYLDSDYISMEI